MQRLFLATALLVCGASLLPAQPAEEFQPLFNGEDLNGWVRVNTAESTWSVQDGMIVCSGKPIGELRTERMYQNFILELEWRHMLPRGNAGVFIWADDITARGVPFHRGIEVQVLENAYGNSASHTVHGDIFPIHGATMEPVNGRGGGSRAFPTEHRSKPSPEWNHYRITCNDGEISLAVNGKVVTRGKNCSPRKGYICLESEGGVVHYRNLRIRELPATPLAEDQLATSDRGYRCLYTGLDLEGWVTSAPGWQPQDWVLSFNGEGEAPLATREQFTNFGFLFDIRRKAESQGTNVSLRDGSVRMNIAPDDPQIGPHLSAPGTWDRFEGTLNGPRLHLSINGQRVIDEDVAGAAQAGPLRFSPQGPVDLANIYVR